MRKVLVIVNILLVLATIMAYFSPAMAPQKFWPIAFAGLLFPLLLFFNIFFVLLWLSFRKRWFLLSLICLFAGWNRIGNFIQLRFSDNRQIEVQDREFLIGSFNALRFYRLEPDQPGFTGRLRELSNTLNQGARLDFLCLQEGRVDEDILNALGFKHQVRTGKAPVFILSNHPIINSESFDFGDELNYCGWADVETPYGKIRIYNLHLYSNLITNEAEQLMEERNFNDSKTWYSAGEIMRRYRRATISRSEQAEVIQNHILSSPYPVIVCGDFNDIPLSYVYHTIKGDLKDSFEQCGNGIGATYNGRIPGLRIDHILTGDTFEVLSHSIVKGNYSDHYPITSKVRIR